MASPHCPRPPPPPPPLLSAPFVSSRTLREALELEPPAALAAAVKGLFASSAPVALRVPSLWLRNSQGVLEPRSTARVCWSAADGLLVLFEAGHPFAAARDDPSDKCSIGRDSRVEAFVTPIEQQQEEQRPGTEYSGLLQRYCGFEMNRAGRCLDFTVALQPRRFDYTWGGQAQLLATWDEEGNGESPASSASTFMLVQLPWEDLLSPSQLRRIQQAAESGSVDSASAAGALPHFFLGLYRGEALPLPPSAAPDASPEFVWQSWRDPLSPQVDFHVPETFGRLALQPPPSAGSAKQSGPLQHAGARDSASGLSLLDDATAAAESLSDVSCIAPGLFQGSLSSLSARTLSAFGVTRVVNCAAGSVRAPADCYAAGSGREELRLFLEDELSQDLFDVRLPPSQQQLQGARAANVVDAAQWIAAARAEGHSVLVHCVQGRSRSAAVLLFHLMRSQRMHVQTALALLQRARPGARPNAAFLAQLTRWCAAEEIPPPMPSETASGEQPQVPARGEEEGKERSVPPE